jgi:NADH-quinone oxidoreductase subunit C
MKADKPPEPASSLELLCDNYREGVVETSVPQGDETAVLHPEWLIRVMEFLLRDPRTQFNVLVDLTAVDYLGRKPRFEVIYHLLSYPRNGRLRIKVRVDEGEALASVSSLWNSANWLEREVWDMFGIRFAGHPNLKRILMYEPFEGHALRKDYPIRKRQPLTGPKN